MSGTAMIVDDSLTVRMDLTEAFEAAGFRSIPCASAREARDLLRAQRVDVAVLDVLLPDGDGIQLLDEIRAAPGGGNTVVLVLSTERDVRDRIRGLRSGADEYLGKPCDRDRVVARAREFLRRRGAAGSPAPVSVLVIDDSATLREELRGALDAAGYAVLAAATGEEGLRLAAEHRPGALVVDGMLPGMDGASVIRHVRLDGALRSIPCLLLTGASDRRAELAALDAGADAFVRKDEGVPMVLAKLEAALRSAQASPPPGAETLLGPKRLLAVDDSETFLQEIADAFRADGHEVVLARSGAEALDLLSLQPIDCILLDLVMPGMSGEETCRRIKAAPGLRNTPLVMLTAREDRDAMIAGLGAGADDYISKSSDLDVLRARVRAQFRRKQFEDENRRIREELLQKDLEAAAARAAREDAEARATLADELERKNRELEAFSYSVSHDLRAPLRAIEGFSRILLEDHAASLDEDGTRCLDVIVGSTRKMGQLIDDLLTFSRMGRVAMDRARVDMEALADSVFAELREGAPGRNVEFRRGGLPSVVGDLGTLRQVVVNLLSNALKYSRGRDPAIIEFGGVRRAGEVEYWCRDNGVGFDMQYAQKLFGVFQRLHSERDFEGTGVGLAIVERIVRRHGGHVRADAAPGQGATFRLVLPDAGGGDG